MLWPCVTIGAVMTRSLPRARLTAYGFAAVLVFATASGQVWLLGTAFERVSPVPLLTGLGLFTIWISSITDNPVGTPESAPADQLFAGAESRWIAASGATLTLIGVAMTGRSGLALLLAMLPIAIEAVAPPSTQRTLE